VSRAYGLSDGYPGLTKVPGGACSALRQTNAAAAALECRTVRIWAAAIAVIGMGGGCNYGPYTFRCTDDASCGPGGKCEPGFNLCSFDDRHCVSGRSFGELGGSNAGHCIGSQPPPDAGPLDAPQACYGSAPYTVCFASAPTGNLDIAMPTTFDTVTGTMAGTQLNCTTPMSGGNGYCVLAANTINIGAPLRAIGSKPLVLVAATSISVPASGSIDVGSHRLPAESIGAGADPATGCSAGTPPGSANGTSGGGAGGSFVGAGGNGGNGGGGGGAGGTRGSTISQFTALRGGCPGQDGAGNQKGARGHGGGAVFLIAGNTILVGGTINAGGEGGAGATGQDTGGGGGGAGGMIGFDAATIMFTGVLIANGGGGAEGSGNTSTGNSGGDATSTNAAAGGTGGTTVAGDGGAGSAGIAAGPGAAGTDGNSVNGGGGGGGGGGAGLIKGPPASLATNVSPAATP
jgi:hypothetical protein